MRPPARRTVRIAFGIVVLLAARATPAADRWLPPHCVELAEVHHRELGTDPEERAVARWNASYREGFRALDESDLPRAERAFCAALVAARGLGPRDWRFAETLDELGLVAYLDGDLEHAEAMQGAAVAEMLLALGPRGEAQLVSKPGRPDCLSSVATYVERLGLIWSATGRDDLGSIALDEPWRVLEWAYLPLDGHLARRIEWLISEYLLAENMAAADALSAVQDEIRR